MTDCKEQQIIDALMARLAAIRTPDFYTDMGAALYQGRGKLPKDSCPYLAVATDEDRSYEQKPDYQVRDRLPVLIEGCVAVDDPMNPDKSARRAYQDILRAIWGPEKEARYLGGLVLDLNYGGRRYLPREDGANQVYVHVFLQCAYLLDLIDP